MWAIVQKEYRQRARGNATVGLIITYTVILGCVSYFIYLATYGSVAAQLSTSDVIGRAISTGTLIAQLIMALLLAISLNATSIAAEKDQETFDLLNLTLFKSFEIVLGKYISSTGFLFILVITALPIHTLAFTFGGVEPSSLWRVGVIVIGMTLLISAVGLLFSLISADLRSALGASFLSLVAFAVVSTVMGAILFSSLRGAPPNPLVYWFGALSMLINPLWSSGDVLGLPLSAQVMWSSPQPLVVPFLLKNLWLWGAVTQVLLAALILTATSLIYPRYRASRSGGVA
jgi:hypothetical protein